MRTVKKFLATALAMAMCVTMIGTADVSAATKVKLNKTKATVTVGKSVTLKVKGTKVKVKWLTSNKKVAVVKKGKVTGKKAGKATITAKVGKKAYKCKVTVKNKEQETTKPVETTTTPAATVTPSVNPTPTTPNKPEETTTPEVEDKFSQDEVFHYLANNRTKTITITNYKYKYNEENDEGSELVIPEEIGGYKVTKIADRVGGDNIKKITIPSTVTEINKYALKNTYIEKDNFINNSSLDEEGNNYWGATVYDTVDETGSMYFRDGKLIRFRQNIPTGEYDEFGDSIMNKTMEVTITSDIKGYADNLFTYGCEFLNRDEMTLEDKYAYDTEETELDKLTINEDVTDIPSDAFKGVVLPNKSSLVNNSSLDAEDNDYWGIRFIDE